VVAEYNAPLFFWMLESLSARFGRKKAEATGTHGGAAPAGAPHAPREEMDMDASPFSKPSRGSR
jgi:hypothetical protein